jgi:VanZ family protein
VQSKTLKRWVPFFVWMALIFVGSSIPRLSGDEFGLPRYADKVAHFLEYLVLGYLFYRGIRGEGRRMGFHALLIVIATGMVIASIDEFHQSFIPGRDANFWDATADMAGIMTGALIGIGRTWALFGRPENR